MALAMLLQKQRDEYLVKIVDCMLNGIVVEFEDLYYDQLKD